MTATRDPYRITFEVGATLIASLDLDEVFATIARQVGEALDVQWCDINEYDPVANTMTYVAVWSTHLRQEDLDYLGTVISLNERPERDAVIRKGDILESYLDDPELDPREREVMQRYDERAVMEIPLVYGDETIGVLGVVESRRARRFNEEDRALLRLLARPAAAAIGNARAYRAQRERARRTAALLDSSRALAGAADIDEVLTGVVRLAVDVCGVSSSAIYEYIPDSESIVHKASYTIRAPAESLPDDELGTVYALRDCPSERRVLDEGRLVEDHLSDGDLADDRRAAMEAWCVQSCLNVPLRFDHAPVGLLRLYDTERERRFGDDDLELVAGLGELASTAIVNVRLHSRQRDQSRRLLSLFDASRSITGALEEGEVVRQVREEVFRVIPGDTAAVRVWTRAGDGALHVHGCDDDGPAPALPWAAAEAAGSGAPAQEPTDTGSRLVVPLAVRGRVRGLLEVESRRGFYDDELVELLQVVANHAAAALANADLYARVQAQAISDGLTGLYNHRYFYARLEQECARACRYDLPLSLLMIDIDDFKRFNDSHGHLRGDQVLRDVAGILRDGIRGGLDLPARYGGEEFAVILPHTMATGAGMVGERILRLIADGAGRAGPPVIPPPGNGAAAVGERLRRDVEERAFAGASQPATVTVCVGVASAIGSEASGSVLVSQADRALYVAKRSGKNRVEVYS